MKPLFARRRFLRGAGGVALGLPFLPSLCKTAFGADPVVPRRARFVNLATWHGGLYGSNMFPPDGDIKQKQILAPGHEIGNGPLTRRVDGNDAYLSAVLRAPASALTERIVGKMNVVQGLDIPWYIAHHQGGHLGNYARNDGNGAEGRAMQANPIPTIDQIMGWSPSFYQDLGGVRERVIVMGRPDGFSFNWSDPMTKTGVIQEQRPVPNSKTLFDRLFVPSGGPAPTPSRAPIVNRVMEDYKRLRNGNLRLSSDDKRRLDDHLSRLAELDRKLNAKAPVAAALCMDVKPATSDAQAMTDRRQALGVFNDVLVAAFLCGTSRIANIAAYETYIPYPGDWHAEVAHQWVTPKAQALLVDNNRAFFESGFLDLARKLDVEESPGVTVLDNTLIAWTQESGQQTHDSSSLPLVTAGAAAGWLRTGLFCDYRNKTMVWDQAVPPYYYGIGWHQWLGTVLTAMGIPRQEYARAGMTGYGQPLVGPYHGPKYVAGVLDRGDEPLPFLKA
jgi:hypothetical protein